MNVVVPYDQLQPETLRAIIEDFATRDGSVQGHRDRSLESNRQEIERALQAGEAIIVFNEDEETLTIVPSAAWHKASARQNTERRIDPIAE